MKNATRPFHLYGENNCRYSNNPFRFTFEFIRSKDSINDATNGLITRNLTKDEQAVLALLSKEQHCLKAEIGGMIGKSTATVQRIIKSLKERDLIKRVESNKTGCWTVNIV